MSPRLFDATAFARRLAERIGALEISLREAARQANVSVATMSRACNGDPNTSHENILRLSAWLGEGEQRNAA